MYDVFLDTEYKDKGGAIFLIGIRTTHGEKFSLYGPNLRWNVLEKILRDKKRIYVYGPDIGKLETHFGKLIKPNWYCINVFSIVKKFLPEIEKKSLINVEKYMGLTRQSTAFKTYTRTLDIHWKDPKKRKGIINYNMEDVVFLETCYNIMHDVIKFDPDDFRIKAK
ncbi:MAG: ribonuclease H-like domain-containing protein [Bacteroidota bacterium]